MGCRVTVAMEFTSVEATAVAFTLTSMAGGSVEGTAVVCVDARYGAVQWRGAARLDRRHVPAARWAVLAELLSALTPGAEVPAELADWLRTGCAVSVRCAAVHPIVAAPLALTAALDALLV